MQDIRWIRLEENLRGRGWTTMDNVFHAPHDTMWFSRNSDNANMASFREQMGKAAVASAVYAEVDGDHAALHEDLISLVAALDEAHEGSEDAPLKN